MRKRFISILACSVIAATGIAGMAGAAGCADGDKLTVWGPTEQQETLKTMVAQFKEANPDVTVNIEVGTMSEGDANAVVTKDPEAAADVYAYANDQIVNLVRAGALAEIGGSYKTAIEQNNGEGAVLAGQVNGKQYGYPYSADNGYFLFYNKSVVSNEAATTLEGLIDACKTAGKTIGWPIDTAWYTAGWFFTFGGTYSVVYNDDGTEKEVSCNFGSDEVGLKTAEAIAKLTASGAFAGKGTGNSQIWDNLSEDGSYGAAIGGTWLAEKLQENLGDNYGVAKLPTVNVGGTDYQLKSFAGYKLYGVNPHSKDLTTAHKLAAFLSGEEMQQLRFDNHHIGPSNKKVAESDAVKANAALAALAEQSAYAVAQTAVPENFWEPVQNFGIAVIDGLADEAAVKAELAKMAALIVPKAEFSYAYLVGTINSWNASENPRVEAQKFTTTDPDKKVWTLEYTFTAEQVAVVNDPTNTPDVVGAQVKVVKVDTTDKASWSNDQNVLVTEAGTYTLTYNLETDKLTAEKKV